MKRVFLIIGIGVLTIALSAFGWNFLRKEKKQILNKDQNNAAKFSVLIVATGFSNERSNISFNELKEEYCRGNVYVLNSIYKEVQDYFKENGYQVDCKLSVPMESVEDFSQKAKGKILITDLANMTSTYKALSVDGVNFFENPDEYKLIVGDRIDFKRLLTKYTMTGVTAITRAAGRVADKEGIDFLTKNLKPYFQNSDFVHISNEVSFKDSCEYIPGTTRFCTKEIHFKALTDLNCNIVELTGNHNRDYGDQAFRKTIQWYKDHNIKIFGGGITPQEANTPLVITMKDGKRLGLIGFNEACPLGECARREGEVGANFYEKEKAKTVIKKMRE